MIRREEMLAQAVEADPSFAPALAAYRETWRDTANPPGYVALGELARHLIAQLDRGETANFPAVFAMVETWIVNGDRYVVNAAVVGLLETIQNICSHGDASADRFVPWLGPKSRDAWEDLNSFWHGHTHSPAGPPKA